MPRFATDDPIVEPKPRFGAEDPIVEAKGAPVVPAAQPLDATKGISPRYGVRNGKVFLKPSAVGPTPPVETFGRQLGEGWQDINKPLVTLGRDTTPQETAGMGTVAKAAIGTGEGFKHATEGLTSPLSLATFGTGAALAKAAPIISRALAGVFAGLSVKQAAETAGDLAGLPKNQRDAKTVAAHLTDMVAAGGMGAVAGYDAAFAKHPTVAEAQKPATVVVPPQVAMPRAKAAAAAAGVRVEAPPGVAPTPPETPPGTLATPIETGPVLSEADARRAQARAETAARRAQAKAETAARHPAQAAPPQPQPAPVAAARPGVVPVAPPPQQQDPNAPIGNPAPIAPVVDPELALPVGEKLPTSTGIEGRQNEEPNPNERSASVGKMGRAVPQEVAAPKQLPEGEKPFESLSNPNSGLPAGVPDRGPDFPQHLMEASRQLGALARSKVTLRPGVQGRYVQTLAGDRIETRDIRNQNTVAHEIGHALDATVFPGANMGESQASLAARIGTGTGKELTQELKSVSELMRGPMTGSKSHVAYRSRATELIADYFSLYAHDADRARAMAPKFTAGFEKALAAHPDAKAVVDGLVAGNVAPEAPTRATPGTTTTPVKLAGKVAPRPDVVTPREREAAHAAEGLVKGAVRTLEAETQSSRVLADKWRKQVPKENDRYDVGAFVEGIGNLQIKSDTIDAVKARMTPQKLALASEYRYRTELARQKINEFLKDSEDGEYLRFVEDYLGHFYADDPKQLRAATSKFSKDSPHAKARKLPTLKEAVDMGLTPITQDPATTYELTNKINWRVATNRKFVSEMKDLKGANGVPMVVPAKDAPPGWHITDNPLIQRVYARKAGDATMLWKGGAGIHPDVWRAARQILDNPTRGDLAKAYDAVNGVTRANAFAFSFFHDLNLRAATVGVQMSPVNPMRGLVRLMEVNPLTGEREAFKSTRGLGKDLLQSEEAVRDAALHGLRFSYTESEAYQQEARTFMDKIAAKTRTVPYAGKATAALRDLQQKRFEGLWKNTHDAYKIAAYNDLVGKALQNAPPGVDPAEGKIKIASMLNDAFGGQEWQSKFWLSPQMRTAAHRFFLASDWTLSTLRSVPGMSDAATAANRPAPSRNYEGASGNISRGKFWTAEVAGLAMATVAAQYAIYSAFGKPDKKDKPWVWDNEYGNRYTVDVTPIMRALPWANPNDPTRHYINLGKRAAEVTRWFSHPEQNIEAKASRPVAEMFKQLTGDSGGGFKEPWAQDHETFIESLPARAKSIGTEFFPFVFSGSQFAMSVPMRKGMTKYKAQQAYESVYELVGDPMGPAKSVLRGQPLPEGELPKMVEQITDAAQKNGVPAEEVRKQALSTVRGHHYGLYFKALQDQDVKELQKQTEILTKLGTTSRGLEQSISRREKMLPK